MNAPDPSILKILSHNDLFKPLTDGQIGELIDSEVFHVNRYEKNRIIMTQGDLYERLYFVAEGTLAATFQKADGKILLAERLHAPSTVASAILFSRNRRLPVTVTAETRVSLVSIAERDLLNLFQQNREVLLVYLQDMGDKVGFLADKIRYLKMNSLRQKVVSFLLDQEQMQKCSEIRLPYSLETLSELFGVARPSLSRTLSHLNVEGLIEKKKKVVYIPDSQRLREELSD